MRVLTVQQPWAWAIIAGGKDIENRSWATPYRGPVAIIAGLKMDPAATIDPPPVHQIEHGGIIGVVDLVDVSADSKSEWAQEGLFHWHLENPRPIELIEMKGSLGLQRLDEADIARVTAALARAER